MALNNLQVLYAIKPTQTKSLTMKLQSSTLTIKRRKHPFHGHPLYMYKKYSALNNLQDVYATKPTKTKSLTMKLQSSTLAIKRRKHPFHEHLQCNKRQLYQRRQSLNTFWEFVLQEANSYEELFWILDALTLWIINGSMIILIYIPQVTVSCWIVVIIVYIDIFNGLITLNQLFLLHIMSNWHIVFVVENGTVDMRSNPEWNFQL